VLKSLTLFSLTLQSNDWGTHLSSRKNHSYLAALNYGQVRSGGIFIRELVRFILSYANSQTNVSSSHGRSTHEYLRGLGLPFHSHFAPPQAHKISHLSLRRNSRMYLRGILTKGAAR
jgi:hypothetical protein